MSDQPQIATESQPVLVFQVNAWKAKRWGDTVGNPPDSGVVNIWEHKKPESIGHIINEILNANGLTSNDIISIAHEKPERADVGSMEVWLYCRNPKFISEFVLTPHPSMPTTEDEKPESKPLVILQNWVMNLSFMQQTTLMTAVRGPDGRPKYAAPKMLLRWYRRCILVSALDKQVLATPYDPRGGSFTGPSYSENAMAALARGDKSLEHWHPVMERHVDEYVRELDAIPSHFQHHFLHAIQIIGYKHPEMTVRSFWHQTYKRLVCEMNLNPETEEEMDRRLGDNREDWLKTADVATRT